MKIYWHKFYEDYVFIDGDIMLKYSETTGAWCFYHFFKGLNSKNKKFICEIED